MKKTRKEGGGAEGSRERFGDCEEWADGGESGPWASASASSPLLLPLCSGHGAPHLQTQSKWKEWVTREVDGLRASLAVATTGRSHQGSEKAAADNPGFLPLPPRNPLV